MEIIHPEITENNRCCIYKFTFPDGSFYVGSSINLKVRIGNYRRAFKNSVNVNKLVCGKLLIFDTVTFSIIQVLDNPDDLLPMEDKHIKLLFCDKILNRSKSAFGNSFMVKNDKRLSCQKDV